MLEYNGHLNVFSPGAVAYNPGVIFYLHTVINVSIYSFAATFPIL